jgi:hypothetical protein
MLADTKGAIRRKTEQKARRYMSASESAKATSATSSAADCPSTAASAIGSQHLVIGSLADFPLPPADIVAAQTAS